MGNNYDLTKVNAYFSKAFCLVNLEQSKDAIKTYDNLITCFGESKNEEILIQVAKGMVYKGFTQGKLEQSEDAIKTYDTLIARFKNLESEEIQKIISNAKGELNKLQPD